MSSTCPQCGSGDISKNHVEAHDILHCVCVECSKEWIE